MTGLIVLAVLASILGLVLASQATLGVAFVAMGCLFAILARIQQAHMYHRELHPAPWRVAAQARVQQLEEAKRAAQHSAPVLRDETA